MEKHLFFYKQPVYKQLALGSQITKQLLGLNRLSLTKPQLKLQIKEKWKVSKIFIFSWLKE